VPGQLRYHGEVLWPVWHHAAHTIDAAAPLRLGVPRRRPGIQPHHV